MGALEVFHQLHCVVSSTALFFHPLISRPDAFYFPQNLLWQATNVEYYKDKSLAWTDSAATLRQHLGKLGKERTRPIHPFHSRERNLLTLIFSLSLRSLRGPLAPKADVRRRRRRADVQLG